MNVVATVTVVAMLFAGAASAVEVKDRGAYIGGAVGVTELNNDLFDDLDGLPGVTIDTEGTGIQLWGGYKFFKWFAVEGRYSYLGEYTADEVFAGGTANLTAEALTGNAVFILPFGTSSIDIYGQVGLGILGYDLEFWESSVGGNVSSSNDGTELVGTAGAGVRWTPAPPLTISLGIDAWTANIDDDGLDQDYTVIMSRLGVQYNF